MTKFLNYLARRFHSESSEEVTDQLKLWVVCDKLHNSNLINRIPSKRVYEYYLFFCKIYNYEAVSQIAFSRFLCRWFPYRTFVRRMWDDGERKNVRYFSKRY